MDRNHPSSYRYRNHPSPYQHAKSGRVVWEQELYRDFQYIQEKPFFYSFATDVRTTPDEATAWTNFPDPL